MDELIDMIENDIKFIERKHLKGMRDGIEIQSLVNRLNEYKNKIKNLGERSEPPHPLATK